jgi:4-hydroxybenzoate polyprenyltransferase
VTWSVALRLGRVSNLPTVWTNVWAGIALARGDPCDLRVPLAALSLSLFYVSGMYLNDAFDRELDARERPDRPIPSRQATVPVVFGAGFALLLGGLGLLALIGAASGWRAPTAGVALAAAIVFYDWYHKGNPLSPVVMGICRVLVYVTAALTVSVVLPPQLWLAAAVALAYLIGLTYVAKQETLRRVDNLWPLAFLAVPFVYGIPIAASGRLAAVVFAVFLGWVLYALSLLMHPGRIDVPRAVASLIAGISLLDALFLVGQGQTVLVWIVLGAFLLTLVLQRSVPST